MMSKLLWTGLFITVALFADVTGMWVGTAEATHPDGSKHEDPIYLQVKQTGSELTGLLGSGKEEFAISNGKVEGDKVSFTVSPGEGAPAWTFRLTAAGDTLSGERSGTDKGGQPTGGRVVLKRTIEP